MEKYFRRLVVAVLICAAGEYLAAAQTTVIDLSKNGDWAAAPQQNASAIRAAFRKAP